MDYYNVDTSAFTKPPIVMHVSRASSVVSRSDLYFGGQSDSSNIVAGAWDADYFGSYGVVLNDSLSSSSSTRLAFGMPQFKVAAQISPASEKHSSAHLKSKLEVVYCNDEAARYDESQSRAALRAVVYAVEDLVDEHDYPALDTLLSAVDPVRLRPVTAVAFLRSSFNVRDKLQSWNGLYQVVYAHLSNTGQNPSRAMRGLSPAQAARIA